ncbi:MAG: hypothetical protein MJZ64_00195 [Paludibacteraceae bacterium]|nr:hypothetical protein [Paludibacteraceae bacterium]
MKKVLFLIAIAMMPFVFNGCKNKENVENPLVGNWVIIGDADTYDYNVRFEGVEEYLSFQDNGNCVEYLYGGKYTEASWDNGTLSGESWIPYKTYQWKSADNTLSFSPEFWGTSEVSYKKVTNDIIVIESIGLAFGRVKQIVTTK